MLPRPYHLFAIVIGLVGLLAACTANNNQAASQPATDQPPPTPTATAAAELSPTAPLPTNAPAARALPTLTAEQALPFLTIQDMVGACQEFHPNRSRTVIQHMDWLTKPDEIPSQFNNLYGNNVQGQLAFGAVYMVAVQWKLNGKQLDSCLIPIGERLNTMTAALGKQPVPEFGFAAP